MIERLIKYRLERTEFKGQRILLNALLRCFQDFAARGLVDNDSLPPDWRILRPAEQKSDESQNLKLDLGHFSMTLKERTVTLTPKEFALMYFLYHQPGYQAKRRDIEVFLWEENAPASRLYMLVSYIRRKYEVPGEELFITLEDGYRLNL